LGNGIRASLWNADTGKQIPIRPFRPGDYEVSWIAFSPDAKTIALARGDVFLRDAAMGKDLRRLTVNAGGCRTVLFSGDGRTVVGGGGNLTEEVVYFWNVASGKALRQIRAVQGYFQGDSLSLSPDGKILATGGDPIRLWDAGTGKELGQVPGSGRPSFSPDGRTLAAADRNGLVLFETLTRKKRGYVPGLRDHNTTFAFAPDSRTVAVNGFAGAIHLVDVLSGEDSRPLGGHLGLIFRIALSADGKRLASAGTDQTARVWDAVTGQELRRFRTSDGQSGAVALSQDGKTLATVREGVRLWDVASGRQVARFGQDWQGPIKALAFSPDGKRLAASGFGTRAWDLSSGKELFWVKSGGSDSLAFSPDGKVLASGGPIQFLDAGSGQLLRTLDNLRPDLPFVFSPDGRSLAVGGQLDGRNVTVFEVATGKLRHRLQTLPAPALAVGPGGRILAAAEESDIVLWDLATSTQLTRLGGAISRRANLVFDPIPISRVFCLEAGHQAAVSALVFGPCGKSLYSASADSTILCWDLPTLALPPVPLSPPSVAALPADKALFLMERGETKVLLEGLEHPEPDVRRDAVFKLGRAAATEAAVVAALTRGLDDKDDAVRAEILQVLTDARPPARGAVAKLAQLLKRGSARDRSLAAAALEAIGPAAGPEAKRLLAAFRGQALNSKPLPPAVPGPTKPGGLDRYGDPLPAGAIVRLGTGRLRHPYLNAIAFSPDGKTLASTGGGGLRLWDVDTGKESAQLREHPGDGPDFFRGSGVAFTPDGKSVLAVDDRNGIRFRDLANGKELRRFPGGNWGIGAFSLSPDGKVLAANCGNTYVAVWDAASGKELHRLAAEGGGLVKFSADSRLLLLLARRWVVATGKELPPIHAGDEFITSADLSPDAKVLATSHGDPNSLSQGSVPFPPSVRLWDAVTGKLLRRFPGEQQCIYQVVFSPDGKRLAVVNDEAYVCLWDSTTGKEVVRLPGYRRRLDQVIFSADGRLLAGADTLGRIVIWDLKTQRPLHPFDRDAGFILTVAYSPDGKTIAAAGDPVIRFRDAANGRVLGRLGGPRGPILSLAYSADGGLLAAAGADTVIWDLKSGKPVRRFDDRGGSVALSRNGKHMASGQQPVRLRELATGKELAQLGGAEVFVLAFSPNGRRLAAACSRQQSSLFSVPGGRVLTPLGTLENQTGMVTGLAFSPNGLTVAYVELNQGLSFMQTEPGNGKHSRFTWEGTQGVSAVAWSPGGKTLALGWEDGTTSLWASASGTERFRFGKVQARVAALAFSPDGRTLTAVYSDGTALVWEVGAPAGV
jgi:WD40 repeat protein